MMDPNLVSIRDLSTHDIPMVLNYWYRSPPEFLEGIGVDLAKLPAQDEFETGLRLRITEHRRTGKSNALAILCDGKVVGMHTLSPFVEGDSGVFHAHIFIPEFRGKGVGLVSYPKACAVFFERFRLRRILFKTPKQNVGAIRVKEKLGLVCTGEEKIGFGIIKQGTRALCYQMTPDFLRSHEPLRQNMPLESESK